MNAQCDICQSTFGCDKQSLKSSTYIFNGVKVILCCPCEDDILKKLAKGRGIKIHYGDGGEVESIKVSKYLEVKK